MSACSMRFLPAACRCGTIHYLPHEVDGDPSVKQHALNRIGEEERSDEDKVRVGHVAHGRLPRTHDPKRREQDEWEHRSHGNLGEATHTTPCHMSHGSERAVRGGGGRLAQGRMVPGSAWSPRAAPWPSPRPLLATPFRKRRTVRAPGRKTPLTSPRWLHPHEHRPLGSRMLTSGRPGSSSRLDTTSNASAAVASHAAFRCWHRNAAQPRGIRREMRRRGARL
jgi:hypothetical protein